MKRELAPQERSAVIPVAAPATAAVSGDMDVRITLGSANDLCDICLAAAVVTVLLNLGLSIPQEALQGLVALIEAATAAKAAEVRPAGV